MRMNAAGLCLAILAGAGLCAAQTAPAPAPAAPEPVAAEPAAAPAVHQPDYSTVYCSGFVTDQLVPEDMHVIRIVPSRFTARDDMAAAAAALSRILGRLG